MIRWKEGQVGQSETRFSWIFRVKFVLLPGFTPVCLTDSCSFSSFWYLFTMPKFMSKLLLSVNWWSHHTWITKGATRAGNHVSMAQQPEKTLMKNIECADIFHQSFLWLLCHTEEPLRGRNSCLWLQFRSVLSSVGVVLMSCRVNFHVVR